jgi:SOS regulatory protein LexA
MLTKRQKQVLDFITEYQERKGYAPALEEIRKRFKLASVSTAHFHVKKLEGLGYITKEENKPRSIDVYTSEQMVKIPLLGTIAAGEPIEAIQEKETIAIPKSKLPKGTDIYALRISGSSMIDENINDGDVVIIKNQPTADNGQKIVALIDNNEVTLKKYYKEKGGIRLQPANPKLQPKYVHPAQLTIQGIVVDVIKQPEERPFSVDIVPKTPEIESTLTNKNIHKKNLVKILHGDAMEFYDNCEAPTVIISDGPYGISGFPGDPPTHEGLGEWYEPHIKKWSEKATPQTTLWFWNTEVGWATVHPILVKHGWKYRNCHVWDKGIGHIAGNVNGKSIRKLPVVTEVCVQYTKEPSFEVEGKKLSMKEWLRYEWSRTGLPFSKTNAACGVKDAATRKYFTLSHLWYFPPAEAFEKIQQYANLHGKKTGRPYFSMDGEKPISKEEWLKFRAKFNFSHGITNVWHEPTVNGKERLRNGAKSLHLNQKPLKLMSLIIRASSDPNDLVWEPFGGLCTGIISAAELNRKGIACEVDKLVYQEALKRFDQHFGQSKLVPLPLF